MVDFKNKKYTMTNAVLSRICFLACLFICLFSLACQAGVSAAAGGIVSDRTVEKTSWENSVVRIASTRKTYNFYQPWGVFGGKGESMGVVLSGQRILTLADGLENNTLVRVQKKGRGRWYTARIDWIDYHTNLAIVSLDDKMFWQGLSPVSLAPVVPSTGEVRVVRWEEGVLNSWKAEVTGLLVGSSYLSPVNHTFIELSSNIDGAGWSEPIVRDGQLLGMSTNHDGQRLSVMPSDFIRFVLDARSKPNYPGIGFFDFKWQYTTNPEMTKMLKLPGEPRGVMVVTVPKMAAEKNTLKPHDIILSINNNDIQSNGDYEDPVYGFLRFTRLASHGVVAGDELDFRVWRDGAEINVKYKLPVVDFAASLVPLRIYDHKPEYYIAGGLVFQPLTEQFLRSWGDSWWGRAPFSLVHLTRSDVTKERKKLVIIASILADPYVLGYQGYRYLVVDKINGKHIESVADVKAALASGKGEYHVIDFTPSLRPRKMILDAAELEEATNRVIKRYGIAKASFIESK